MSNTKADDAELEKRIKTIVSKTSKSSAKAQLKELANGAAVLILSNGVQVPAVDEDGNRARLLGNGWVSYKTGKLLKPSDDGTVAVFEKAKLISVFEELSEIGAIELFQSEPGFGLVSQAKDLLDKKDTAGPQSIGTPGVGKGDVAGVGAIPPAQSAGGNASSGMGAASPGVSNSASSGIAENPFKKPKDVSDIKPDGTGGAAVDPGGVVPSKSSGGVPTYTLSNGQQVLREGEGGAGKPDGEGGVVYEDGTRVSVGPDGDTVVTRADGTQSSRAAPEQSGFGSIGEGTDMGGIELSKSSDGQSTYTLSNGQQVVRSGQGGEGRPDGTGGVIYEDGTTVHVAPDGSTVTTRPDGSTTTMNPPPSFGVGFNGGSAPKLGTHENADGSVDDVYQLSNGHEVLARGPDGTLGTVDDKGGISYPDGTYVYVNEKGDTVGIRDGDEVLFRPSQSGSTVSVEGTSKKNPNEDSQGSGSSSGSSSSSSSDSKDDKSKDEDSGSSSKDDDDSGSSSDDSTDDSGDDAGDDSGDSGEGETDGEGANEQSLGPGGYNQAGAKNTVDAFVARKTGEGREPESTRPGGKGSGSGGAPGVVGQPGAGGEGEGSVPDVGPNKGGENTGPVFIDPTARGQRNLGPEAVIDPTGISDEIREERNEALDTLEDIENVTNPGG
ncbi:T-complex 10 C-terminal domain-containing protein [Pelagicoccus albus]|uniref:Uncharacterized protein n=1 Tax=Pelagicoccus albus TaxID=415222 RepID=A0A7X1E9R6_9BACT|nr:T-complex 10 C-terminal domain-containing protein [Pelagicoccus albus]MBC2607473.1 hypothetical protein [Pelagicoccus albus]